MTLGYITGGTVSVSNGGTAVTGVGTAFTEVSVGATFEADGQVVRIAAIASDTALTLAYAWPGTTLSASSAFTLGQVSENGSVALQNNLKIREYLAELSARATVHRVEGVPSPSLGINGDFAIDVTNEDIYFKASGAWSSVITDLAGPAGADGADGADGSNGAVWFTSVGDPDNGTGADGDYNLKSDGTVWQKSSGSWSQTSIDLTGPEGPRGEAFIPDAQEPAANRSNYDGEADNFAFLATDTNQVSWKQSATSGDWSAWVDWGGGVSTAADVGLGNVDNTSDANKPVSTAQRAAIDQQTTFRNKIINGDFQVWQRGATFNGAANSAYTADRWQIGYDGAGATRNVTRQDFALGQTDVPGNPKHFLRYDQTVAGSGGTFSVINHRLEQVRTFAGQTVTLSFYAKASSAITLPFINADQSFGTGGSPSAYASTSVSTNISVTTSWQRFTYQVAIPSISGKSLGTNNNDQLILFFGFPTNTTFTIDIANVQLEAGSIATDFEQLDYAEQLRRCQRYYETGRSALVLVGHDNASALRAEFKVTKRAAPTGTISSVVYKHTGSSDPYTETPQPDSMTIRQINGNGRTDWIVNWTAEAEL